MIYLRVILFFLLYTSPPLIVCGDQDKKSLELDSSPALDSRLIVIKRFTAQQADGLYGFSEGKEVTLVAEDGDKYIVTDGTIEGRAPKSFFQLKSQIVESHNKDALNSIGSPEAGLPPAEEASPSPSPRIPHTLVNQRVQEYVIVTESEPKQEGSIGDVIRRMFKGNQDDVFMQSYFSDKTLIAIGTCVILLMALAIFLFISHKVRVCNETPEEKQIRKYESQINGHKISISIALCWALYFMLFFDTTVQVERQPAKYYNGVQIVPETPAFRVHNLERAGFQRNMVMFFIGLSIVNAICIISAAKSKR